MEILRPDISFFYLSNVVQSCKTFKQIKKELSDLYLKQVLKSPITIQYCFNVLGQKVYIHNKSLSFILKQKNDEEWGRYLVKYKEGYDFFFFNYINCNLQTEDKIRNISYRFNEFWKHSIRKHYDVIDEEEIERIVYYEGVLRAYIEYEKENEYLLSKYIGNVEETTLNLTTKEEQITHSSNKIPVNGNYQMLMFLFSELIHKGYITAPKHNGKISHKRTAEMLLKHFEFTNKEEQPSTENLTQYLKNNQYSLEKQELFKIPKMENAND